MRPTVSSTGTEAVIPSDEPVDNLAPETATLVNPKVLAAIRAIEAERTGDEPSDWADFSSHKSS